MKLLWFQILANMVHGGHQIQTPNPKHAQYEGHITTYVILACIVGAFGGLIFGYDIGISGFVGILMCIKYKVINFLMQTKNMKINKKLCIHHRI